MFVQFFLIHPVDGIQMDALRNYEKLAEPSLSDRL